jgi:hypothetical protein
VPNTLDAALNPDGHVLIPNFQVPKTMSGLHCRMAGALDGSTAANLFSSISYGINFDVKDATGLPYCASSNSSPYSVDFPNNLSANDKQPDQYRSTEILNPSQFILISEANTQGPEWNGRWCGVWSTVATYNVGDIVAGLTTAWRPTRVRNHPMRAGSPLSRTGPAGGSARGATTVATRADGAAHGALLRRTMWAI